MNAPTLFDLPADPLAARSSDPATSRVAARMLRVKDRKREVLDAMTRLNGTVTAGDIKRDMERHGIVRERGTVASRLSQLERDGLVRKVGVKQVAKPVGSGRPEITWRLV